MSRHHIEDGGNLPADIIERIERARRDISTREGIASAYRRLDKARVRARGGPLLPLIPLVRQPPREATGQPCPTTVRSRTNDKF